jgi:hypothetical protein
MLSFNQVSRLRVNNNLAALSKPNFCLYTGTNLLELFAKQQSIDSNITQEFCAALENGDLQKRIHLFEQMDSGKDCV